MTIAVLTFRRPENLAVGLPLLVEQARTMSVDHYQVSLLVIDNDPSRSAAEFVAMLSEAEPFVTYVAEPRPGISAARNRALSEAEESDVLVFIDDDERPEPAWLERMLATWSETGAAAVAGAVVSEFDRPLDEWLQAGQFFVRRRLPTGTRVGTAATNNLLLDLAEIRRRGLGFDDAFGLSGGEDSMFTRSLTANGGELVWCNEAVVVDQVPAERATRSWVICRAASAGNTEVHVDLRLASGVRDRLTVRLKAVGQGTVRIVGGLARYVVGVLTFSKAHEARGLRTAARGAGKLAAAAGFVYREYRR